MDLPAHISLRLTSTVRYDHGFDLTLFSNQSLDVTDARLCFSLLSPVEVRKGGKLAREVGGFAEIALDDATIEPGRPLTCTIQYRFERHAPVNISWGPQGAYLRLADGHILPIQTEPPEFPAERLIRTTRPVPEITPLDQTQPVLIPEVQSWQAAEGRVDLGNGLQLQPGEDQATPTKNAAALLRRNGLGTILSPKGIAATLTHAPDLGSEAYEISLAPAQIDITYGDDAGLFYGMISLGLWRAQTKGRLPAGTVKDAPAFPWRGQHLDTARHYYAPETIKRLFDLMALLKLNRFHWHFADDEAFRIALPGFEDLAEATCWRGDSCLIPGVFGGGAGPTGGLYDVTTVKDLIAYAKALHIEVMPEVEFPAHALSITRHAPHTRDPHDPDGARSVQGYLNNTINPAMPETRDFMRGIASALGALFPFRHVHLGGDEPPADMWARSPAIADLKAQHNLTTEDDVFGWMFADLAHDLAQNGITSAAWEEAVRGGNGGIGNDAIIFSWNGTGPGFEAAAMGYRVVICPADHLYFDMAYDDHPDETGLCWAAFVSLEDTVDWSPWPDGGADWTDRIIGVQGAFWSETVTADRQFEPMIAPRILGLAERAWCDPIRPVDKGRFRARVETWDRIFMAMGWANRPDY